VELRTSDFLNWLLRQKKGSVVGNPWQAGLCPVARWLQDDHAIVASVFYQGYYAADVPDEMLPLPEDLVELQHEFDHEFDVDLYQDPDELEVTREAALMCLYRVIINRNGWLE